jgi:hypothetical protein
MRMQAQQWLQAQDGKTHPIAAASYLAFGDEDKLEGSMGSRDLPASIAVETRAAEFAAVIERIEAGEFPPQPRQPGECQWCRYAGVCRKEYREAVDETAESCLTGPRSEGPWVPRGSFREPSKPSEPPEPRTLPRFPPDQPARDFAIAPENDVVLEASAGTGKTRVLVDRYVRLIEKGVDPRHILAITFTRKAAAEMREAGSGRAATPCR